MKNIRNLFIVVTAFFCCFEITAQSKAAPQKKPTVELKSSLDRLTMDAPIITPQIKQKRVFSVESLPIFCKIEHKLAKSSKVNVMMRLGSLDYVNKLEGKGN